MGVPERIVSSQQRIGVCGVCCLHAGGAPGRVVTAPSNPQAPFAMHGSPHAQSKRAVASYSAPAHYVTLLFGTPSGERRVRRHNTVRECRLRGNQCPSRVSCIVQCLHVHLYQCLHHFSPSCGGAALLSLRDILALARKRWAGAPVVEGAVPYVSRHSLEMPSSASGRPPPA